MNTKKLNKKHKKNNRQASSVPPTEWMNLRVPLKKECSHKSYTEGLVLGVGFGVGITICIFLVSTAITESNIKAMYK